MFIRYAQLQTRACNVFSMYARDASHRSSTHQVARPMYKRGVEGRENAPAQISTKLINYPSRAENCAF